MQVVGYIEIDPRSDAVCVKSCESGLWQDLLCLGSESAGSRHSSGNSLPAQTSSPRWERMKDDASAVYNRDCILEADLPRLSRELDAELALLVSRICAARD